MGVYTEAVQFLLKEAANYFFLLLISVLAIRLWRRTARLSAGRKGKTSCWHAWRALWRAASGIFPSAIV